MTVESSHLRNCKDSDAAEASCLYGKDLTLSDIRTKNTFAVTLQTVEGDIGSCDVTLQRTSGEVRIEILPAPADDAESVDI